MNRRSRKIVAAAVAAAVVAGVAAAAVALGGSSSGPTFRVVAAENMWGSLAAQVAGPGAAVTSIVSNLEADPHDYEPTPADARTLANAKLVILNGAGYDAWAQRLLDANPVPGRTVIDVAKLAHVARGGNPHLWYSPAVVAKVVATLSAALPNPHAVDLGHYRAEIALIRRRFSGAPVGASESIFAPLASALGLRLLTPSSFLGAISEGTEPTVADLATIGSQIAHRKIRVWVFNTQNATPDVRGLTQAAQHAGIPVVDVTETLAPAGATFQAWQLRQLRALAAALAAAHA